MTRLSAQLPGGDNNGIGALARDLIDSPRKVHAVIALVDGKTLTTDVDTGATEPTARIRRIEVITDDDRRVAEQILRRAMERRTGQTVLPLDLEDDLTAAFDDVDEWET